MEERAVARRRTPPPTPITEGGLFGIFWLRPSASIHYIFSFFYFWDVSGYLGIFGDIWDILGYWGIFGGYLGIFDIFWYQITHLR